jgi:hypothetical protein
MKISWDYYSQHMEKYSSPVPVTTNQIYMIARVAPSFLRNGPEGWDATTKRPLDLAILLAG